jgi:hypothetical protein
VATTAERATAFGMAVNRAYLAALQDWRSKHAPKVTIDELLAGDVTSVSVEATVFSRGFLTVVTIVRGRRQYDDETHLTRFRMHNGTYRLTGSTLPLP